MKPLSASPISLSRAVRFEQALLAATLANSTFSTLVSIILLGLWSVGYTDEPAKLCSTLQCGILFFIAACPGYMYSAYLKASLRITAEEDTRWAVGYAEET